MLYVTGAEQADLVDKNELEEDACLISAAG